MLRHIGNTLLGRNRWNSDKDQKKLLAEAKVIFDVGANIGQTAERYLKLYPAAQIWSFEPVPEMFAQLQSRFAGNKQIHPVPLALGDAVGTATMNLSKGSQTSSLLMHKNRTGKTIQIRTDTIDNFCASNAVERIDVLKADVEGMEGKVFMGAAEMFRRRSVRLILTEVYFYSVYETMPLFWDLHQQLKGLGFELYGLYSLVRGAEGRLEFANALYVHDG